MTRNRTDRKDHTRGLGRAALIAATAMFALGVAACSDDTSDSSTSSPETTSATLTIDEFRARANAVCTSGTERIDAAAQEALGASDEPPSDTAVTEFLDELIAATRDQIDGIAALAPPDEVADQVTELLATAEDDHAAMVATIEDDPIAFTEADDDSFAATNALAADLGLDACSA